MKVTGMLVTGGGGFIGSHLAEYYLNQNLPVVAVDNFCTSLKTNAEYLKRHKNAKLLHWFEQDVAQPWDSWVSKIPAGVLSQLSHVFHFASPASPPLYQKLALETLWVNSLGLNHALEFADKKNLRVIFASTSEVYGDPNVSPQPESFWGNVNSFGIRSCYDEGKRFGEALLFTHNWKKNTRHGLVRIFNTYGPRMNPADGRVIINFLVQAIRGESLTVYGDGQQTRSFCYISDLIGGITRYAELDICEPVNIGNDRESTILDLAKTVQEIFKDKKLQLDHQILPQDDPKQRCPDLTQAKKRLEPWQPRINLKSGLTEMIRWLEADTSLRQDSK